mgnify:CR=1 FL=1
MRAITKLTMAEVRQWQYARTGNALDYEVAQALIESQDTIRQVENDQLENKILSEMEMKIVRLSQENERLRQQIAESDR